MRIIFLIGDEESCLPTFFDIGVKSHCIEHATLLANIINILKLLSDIYGIKFTEDILINQIQ